MKSAAGQHGEGSCRTLR